MPIEEEDDENRYDFNLLRKQLSNVASSLSSSSAISSGTESEVWPLQLKAVFVDHYIFGDLIGNGSYAEVRECIDTRNLERCAVKIINKDYLRRQASLALTNQLQEIKLLRRLKHDNIISMKECLYKGPKIYMILEYCTYVLSDLMKLNMTLSMKRNLFHQLAFSISYLHSVGIVHRDIKPQNILLTTCGTLKLIDFGVSHILSMWNRNSLCSNYEGSPLFQAPEVVSGQTSYSGFRVDIWSAGVTLYLMVYDQYPFYDESLLGLYNKILSSELSFPDKVNEKLSCHMVLNDLLSKMLDKSADRRILIEEVLDHSWLKLQDKDHNRTHFEFIELMQQQVERENSLQKVTQGQAPKLKDIYKSMSVLPYLYNHHFPHLTITKTRKKAGYTTPSSTGSTELNFRSVSPFIMADVSPAPLTPAHSPALTSTPAPSPHSPGSSTLHSVTDPNEIIEDTPIEWGTEEQYNLLKVPPIRANRIRGRGKYG